jgi:mRNA interferase HigB
MRIIKTTTLSAYWTAHAVTKRSLEHWVLVTKQLSWRTTSEVVATFPKAKALNGERVRFEVAGGNYRLITAFSFQYQIALIKFIGAHAEYDKIDALTVSQF